MTERGRFLSDLDLRPVQKAPPGAFSFELQAIFTDPIGFNFRNDVAHGLLDLRHIDVAELGVCLVVVLPPGVSELSRRSGVR
jgi:hypothetical protein